LERVDAGDSSDIREHLRRFHRMEGLKVESRVRAGSEQPK
jgi:hypothetical protein